MNINKISIAVDKYCELIKKSSNMFLSKFTNDSKSEILLSINSAYRRIIYMKTILDEWENLFADADEDDISSINMHNSNRVRIFLKDIFKYFSKILICFELHQSFYKMDDINVLSSIELKNDSNEIINFTYPLKNIERIEQINILSTLENLCDVLLKEEQNSAMLWNEFLEQFEKILSELCLFCQQIFPKYSSDLESNFKNLINSLDKEGKTFSSHWNQIFDQIEYEEKINHLDPEDFEFLS